MIKEGKNMFCLEKIYLCHYNPALPSFPTSILVIGGSVERPCKNRWKGQMDGYCHSKGRFLIMAQLNQTKMTIKAD